MPARPLGGVSLDLDDLWAYLKAQGNPAWKSYPSFLDRVVPLALEELAALHLRITVFAVGADAADPGRGAWVRALAGAGHEIASHSHRHDTWLHRYTTAELAAELDRAADAIAAATGRRPVGFRGPGFTRHPDLSRLLVERGFVYDSSVLPTWVGPVAQWYYRRTVRLTPDQVAERRGMFGRLGDVLHPNRPWIERLPQGELVELPATTAPVLRTPVHMTYLLFLAERSERLMWAYFRAALAACSAAGTPPNFVLHLTDFIGADCVPELATLPAMGLPGSRKRELVRRALAALHQRFDLVPLAAWSGALLGLPGAAIEPASAAGAL